MSPEIITDPRAVSKNHYWTEQDSVRHYHSLRNRRTDNVE